jgi:hypothetical protein
MNECYNKQFSSIKLGCYNERRCYNERMLQLTVFINKIRMLQRTHTLQWTNATTNSFHQWNQDATMNTDATTNECYNEQFLRIKSRCYNEHRCPNERKLQRTVLINKIRMLQGTPWNTIGRSSTRVRMTCRTFPLWLDRHSSSLLSCVMFSYQFSSVICLFLQCTKVK